MGARVGMTSVLHTWGSALTHHPHIHMIVPGGGLSPGGTRWVACKPGFFLHVRVLSRLFRRLFLEGLMDLHRAGQLAFFGDLERLTHADAFATWLAPFRKSEWVVYAKPPFGGPEAVLAYRHGHRERQLTGTFGTETVRVPRARIEDETGKVTEWRSKALPRYQRLTKKAEALIAAVYLSGTNTRRVKRALFGLFEGAVGKDVVSRAWRKVKVDWDAWCARSLADEDIVRLILDGTVIKTRLDRKATNISVLAAIGVRRDGQKVLLSIRNMGGESTAAWRQFLDDLDARGLKRPEFVIVDGAPGLEAALVALWGDDLPIQRCTVHKHRNLLAHAPKHLHDELTEDYRDMIYADTAAEIEKRRKAFLRKWRLKCRAVADSLEEAGDRLFTFTRLVF